MIDFGLTPGSRIGLLAGNLGEYYTVMFGAPRRGWFCAAEHPASRVHFAVHHPRCGSETADN